MTVTHVAVTTYLIHVKLKILTSFQIFPILYSGLGDVPEIADFPVEILAPI